MGPSEGHDSVCTLQPSAGLVNSSGGGSTFIHQNQLPISFLAGPGGDLFEESKRLFLEQHPLLHPRDANRYVQERAS